MSDNNDELEEGEIADDSNDGCSIANDVAPSDFDIGGETNEPAHVASGATIAGDDGPQKKRKKVVRKVRRTIKVKKKVIRKKGVANSTVNATANAIAISNPNASASDKPTVSTSPLSPPQQIDALWEQQILMLQELQRQQSSHQQQHTQLIRAAATDEDLRIFPPSMIPHHVNQQQITQLKPATDHLAPHRIQQQPVSAAQPLQPSIQGVTTNVTNLPPHQTPSSPDDENGKSSYEAISKMLALLRNSANISETSENTDVDTRNSVDTDQMKQLIDGGSRIIDESQKNEKEYMLVPILIEGIDYTKYKLLSQYEPKFKNDPRLNQQS